MSPLRQFGLPLALFAILWVDLCRQLSYTWDTNEQYAYGWFVPLLALGLFIRRWPTRPSPLRLGRGESDATLAQRMGEGQGVRVSGEVSTSPSHPLQPVECATTPLGRFQHFSISAFVLLLCLLLLPLRVIIEINPDWPLITWPYTLIVVALTLYAIHLAGPRSLPREMAACPVESVPYSTGSPISPGPRPGASAFQRLISAFQHFSVSAFHFPPWVAHFAFPVCFILVAVQWPYRIEHALTQNLMQIVASLTVEIIGWFGIPAIQQGNLIELSTGVLGVDEACSGIRSFQSTLMAALFLGELYLMRTPIRLLLVVAGLGAAFLLNVCRTLILTWQANAHGLSAIDKWHDPAGFTIAIACFGVLWLIAILIKNKWRTAAPLQPVECAAYSTGPRSNLQPSDSGPGTPPSASSKSQLSAFPISAFCFQSLRRYAAAVGLWSLLCIVATEAWYRTHEIKDVGVFHWSVALPESKPGFKKTELPPRSLKLLAFDFGATGQWAEEDGGKWTLYFFRWNPKSIASVLQSRNHRPDVCLPAAGLRQVSESKLDLFDAGSLKLPFRSYIYEADGRTFYVFFCQWEDGAEHQTGLQASKQAGRLQSVLTGRRLLGQQTLELILTGYGSLAEAQAEVRRKLPAIIRPESAGDNAGAVSQRVP